MGSETPSPNLFCKEDVSFLNEKDENLEEFCSVSESDCEFIETSFEKETNFRPNRDDGENQTRVKRSWLKYARLEATRALFGYHYRTAYLSVIYFDRFLEKTWISDGKLWTIRILSIACLSLAAKMEERKVRPLTEYYVEGYNFQGIAIQKMELCVLNALEWRMCIVTPFTYLNYFATKFCLESSHQELVIQAAELILAIMEEINVAENRPSIVAAASVLAAYDHQLDKTNLENKLDAIQSWGALEKRKLGYLLEIELTYQDMLTLNNIGLILQSVAGLLCCGPVVIVYNKHAKISSARIYIIYWLISPGSRENGWLKYFRRLNTS
ncbi:hypothetical protein DH2020_012431 [Rehmannia glutinosa]|uniref:Cyclin-like domain-containing protein n=1 Tax=Rehmannia glutinosa TaxID=99300 RepID=A0ABR0WZB8_REHGL